LQSRGLSRSESLKLITLGYLLPIIEVIDDDNIKERLSLEISKKVSESCLM
jgi:Fe-S cluster assembly protein SufD